MSQIPMKMRAVDCVGPGGPEVMTISQQDVPRPKPNEVLLRVLAAGINRPDIQQRKGAYPPPPDASKILGLEAAGEIVACGSEVTDVSVGDRVTALCNGGAYAEFVAVPAGQCLPWPQGFSATQAAALPETYFTVWANVFELGRLQAGETLLVHGGSSGIGITAIQMAAARGAKIFATAGSAKKCHAIEALGAQAINYRDVDFADIIAAATQNRGVDVVLDMVGGTYTQRNIKVLAPLGRLVQIAFLTGSVIEHFDLLPVMLKRLTITGSTMRPRSAAEKGAIARALREHIWPLFDDGKITPIIDRVFNFDEVARAHELMESSAHIGKIILNIAA